MKRVIVAAVVLFVLCVGTWQLRWLLVRLFPIHHEGTVMRIKPFHKGFSDADTRQQRQFAILFEDGFDCEGYDTSFANVEAGDVIELKAYYDVGGFPILDPEWWECDEAQLVRIVQPHN